jgi:methionyl-tRNA formyltransferase
VAEAELSVVAGSKSWNRRVFDEVIAAYPGEWAFAATTAELDEVVAARIPRRIYFLHWSWIVPDRILAATECVGFHMTDLPYGRGGSPLQNLVVRGHGSTKLTALRMTATVDGGPVYAKRDLDLHGTAEEVYVRTTYLAAEMIRTFLDTDPQPVAQEGEVVAFARRTPSESELPGNLTLPALHDFIRMLDAEGYPHAFLRAHGLRLEFRRAALYDERVEVDVVVTRDDGR